MFCREQAVQLHRVKDRIQARGATLVFVGNGNRHFAKAFADQFELDEPLYVDTKLEAYKALAFKRGLLHLADLQTPARMARALKAGFRQGITRGDTMQLGGVMVVRPGGRVAYRYVGRVPGDHPPVDEVVRSLEA
jgi:peroxiredoxin